MIFVVDNYLFAVRPFLDVLWQLPGRKAVTGAILFRCAGHAGGHIVLPTGRSQRVPQTFLMLGWFKTQKIQRCVLEYSQQTPKTHVSEICGDCQEKLDRFGLEI